MAHRTGRNVWVSDITDNLASTTVPTTFPPTATYIVSPTATSTVPPTATYIAPPTATSTAPAPVPTPGDFSSWDESIKKGYFSGVSVVIFMVPLIILVWFYS